MRKMFLIIKTLNTNSMFIVIVTLPIVREKEFQCAKWERDVLNI